MEHVCMLSLSPLPAVCVDLGVFKDLGNSEHPSDGLDWTGGSSLKSFCQSDPSGLSHKGVKTP